MALIYTRRVGSGIAARRGMFDFVVGLPSRILIGSDEPRKRLVKRLVRVVSGNECEQIHQHSKTQRKSSEAKKHYKSNGAGPEQT